MGSEWKCPLCGHVNSGRVSGMSFGGESYSDFMERASSTANTCAKCGKHWTIEEARAYMANKQRSGGGESCIIATACLGADSEQVTALRQLRDDAITSDPVARDFFHVFWSRYYEWSPSVARIAAADPAVAEHIRWSFLEPWLAWIELASIIGRRSAAELSEAERQDILSRLTEHLDSWFSELPAHLGEKCPDDPETLNESLERFRLATRDIFNTLSHRHESDSEDGEMGG